MGKQVNYKMSLKPEGYEKYSAGSYMKFNQAPSNIGESKAYPIRIMEKPITGYVYWEDSAGNVRPRGSDASTGDKPRRMRASEDFSREQISAMKMFFAMVVYNYEYEKIQVLDITQTGIMNGLDGLYDSKAWGDMSDYDIHIIQTKTGPEKKNVEYNADYFTLTEA